MKHLGDITKIDGTKIEPVWCISGGSPCQDLSIAGKKKGLRHKDLGDEETTRSGLFMEQIRIVREMRSIERTIEVNGTNINFRLPRYLIWENVPGCLSSNFDGFGDFGSVLEEICRLEQPNFVLPRLPGKWKWSKAGVIDLPVGQVAWRIHDAKYFGLAQRRSRICVCADLGGRTAADIVSELVPASNDTDEGEAVTGFGSCKTKGLPVGESLQGITPESREQEQASTGSDEDSTGEHDKVVAIEGNGQRKSHRGDGYSVTDEMYTLNTTEVHGVAYGIDCYNSSVTGDETMTITTGATDPHHIPAVIEVPYTVKVRGGREIDSKGNKAGKGALVQMDLSGTLGVTQDQTLLVPCHAYDMSHATDVIRDCGDESPALMSRMGTGGNQVPIVTGLTKGGNKLPIITDVYSMGHDERTSRLKGDEIVDTLTACDYKQPTTVTYNDSTKWIVRRLSPNECCSLQGFPRGWCDIGDWIDSKGKLHKDSDTPKYKAIGNSIAVGYANNRKGYWCQMFQRMAKYLPERATLGSLFDGIGGFPLAWESIHGKGTARWASEIEEFPIAVTKIRFPEENE